MSADFDHDDFARLLALEHIVTASTLISASNFAAISGMKPSEAVSQFRHAVESSLYDTAQITPATRDAMSKHVSRLFDHLHEMSSHADLGQSENKF